jgi:hypothetical protein
MSNRAIRTVGAMRCERCPLVIPCNADVLAFVMRHRAHGFTLKRRSPGTAPGNVALVCVTCPDARRSIPKETGQAIVSHVCGAAWRLRQVSMTENNARVLARLGYARPVTVATIADALGLAVQTVRDNLRVLEAHGLAVPWNEGGKGRGDVARWILRPE